MWYLIFISPLKTSWFIPNFRRLTPGWACSGYWWIRAFEASFGRCIFCKPSIYAKRKLPVLVGVTRKVVDLEKYLIHGLVVEIVVNLVWRYFPFEGFNK